MTTILEQWQSFEAQAIPERFSQIQRHRLKVAFYGGAAVMLAMMHEVSKSEAPEGVGILHAAEDDIDSFFAQFQQKH
jgi:hypothetical protein